MLRIGDVGIGAIVIRLVVLRDDVQPTGAAYSPNEARHWRAHAVGVVCRSARRDMVEGASLSPAPVHEIDLRIHLDGPSEVRHVDRYRLARCDARRADAKSQAYVCGGWGDAHGRHGVSILTMRDLRASPDRWMKSATDNGADYVAKSRLDHGIVVATCRTLD